MWRCRNTRSKHTKTLVTQHVPNPVESELTFALQWLSEKPWRSISMLQGSQNLWAETDTNHPSAQLRCETCRNVSYWHVSPKKVEWHGYSSFCESANTDLNFYKTRDFDVMKGVRSFPSPVLIRFVTSSKPFQVHSQEWDYKRKCEQVECWKMNQECECDLFALLSLSELHSR